MTSARPTVLVLALAAFAVGCAPASDSASGDAGAQPSPTVTPISLQDRQARMDQERADRERVEELAEVVASERHRLLAEAEIDPDTGLPTLDTEGLAVAEAVAGGWPLHPELPLDLEILVDLRTHTGWNGRRVTPEVVPTLWVSDPSQGLTDSDVNRAISGASCLQDHEPINYLKPHNPNETLETTERLVMVYECEYVGNDAAGETGKPVHRVLIEDIDKQTTTDDGLHVFDNVQCAYRYAPSGCPEGDLALRVTDGEVTIRIDGFERDNGPPTIEMSGRIDGSTSLLMACFEGGAEQCRFGSRATLPASLTWASDAVVTLTVPLRFHRVEKDTGHDHFGFTADLPDIGTWRFEDFSFDIKQDDRNALTLSGIYLDAFERAAGRS